MKGLCPSAPNSITEYGAGRPPSIDPTSPLSLRRLDRLDWSANRP
jgi:hypothetical protein